MLQIRILFFKTAYSLYGHRVDPDNEEVLMIVICTKGPEFGSALKDRQRLIPKSWLIHRSTRCLWRVDVAGNATE